MPKRILSHCDKNIHKIAKVQGWSIGANYKEIRKFRYAGSLYYLDIDWKNYDFDKHLYAARIIKPALTVAKDIENADHLDDIMRQSELLLKHCNTVILVPKDIRLTGNLSQLTISKRILGYSVPTRHGGTAISPLEFHGSVHLLGGRPDQQQVLGNMLYVYSMDCNRLTLDARFGDYFDGETFRPHPQGGYYNCIRDSLRNINRLWRLNRDIHADSASKKCLPTMCCSLTS